MDDDFHQRAAHSLRKAFQKAFPGSAASIFSQEEFYGRPYTGLELEQFARTAEQLARYEIAAFELERTRLRVAAEDEGLDSTGGSP